MLLWLAYVGAGMFDGRNDKQTSLKSVNDSLNPLDSDMSLTLLASLGEKLLFFIISLCLIINPTNL